MLVHRSEPIDYSILVGYEIKKHYISRLHYKNQNIYSLVQKTHHLTLLAFLLKS